MRFLIGRSSHREIDADSKPDADYAVKCRENAKTLASEIRSLKGGHWAGMLRRDYRGFWGHAREISAMFKSLKPLRRKDRENLWSDFSSTCDEVKAAQNGENENRKFKSEEHRRGILHEAERARPCSLFGFMPPDVIEMKALGNVLRKAGQMLSEYKHEMLGEHKQECFARIQEIREIHDLWWEELKSHRSQKHEDFQARVRANLEKNIERHRKATDALQRVRSHADDLREQIDSAWSDGFRERASEWLSEAEDKIRDIEASIERIEEWIHEDEEKLR